MDTNSILNILFLAALLLLVVVSGGAIYLTTIEWRDRRQQDQEKKMGK